MTQPGERKMSLSVPKAAIAPGDRVPNFVLPDAAGTMRMFYGEVTGQQVILAFFSAAHTREDLEEMLRAFKASVAGVMDSRK